MPRTADRSFPRGLPSKHGSVVPPRSLRPQPLLLSSRGGPHILARRCIFAKVGVPTTTHESHCFLKYHDFYERRKKERREKEKREKEKTFENMCDF